MHLLRTRDPSVLFRNSLIKLKTQQCLTALRKERQKHDVFAKRFGGQYNRCGTIITSSFIAERYR